jgi:hypothetical protein
MTTVVAKESLRRSFLRMQEAMEQEATAALIMLALPPRFTLRQWLRCTGRSEPGRNKMVVFGLKASRIYNRLHPTISRRIGVQKYTHADLKNCVEPAYKKFCKQQEENN